MTSSEKQSPKVPIALIGFRGSGKSVVALAMSTLLDGDSVDTDAVVTACAGKTIAEIFSEEGEAAFRRYEAEAIAGAVKSPPSVISVGGGAVLDSENVRRLREACFVVWLTAPADVLWQRISTDPSSASSRPSLTGNGGIDEVRSVLAQREKLYRAAAHATIDTVGRQVEDIAMEIMAMAGET